MDYDEDLSQNEFLRELRQQHEATLQQVIQEGWIVCVPRSGSFSKREFQMHEINAHILIPRQDLFTAQFDSLDGKEILLVDRVLTIKHNTQQYSTRLLFEETFYNSDLQKYCVWCIEQPLETGMCISDSCMSNITNLQEAVNFLQMELLEKELCSDFETKIKDFLYVNKDLNCMPVQTQRDLVYSLYADCLRILLENAASREKVLSSRHYYWSIRVSLETYILYILRHVLLKSLSAGTAAEDAALNKITRNLSEIRLEDLLIRSDLQSRVDGGRLELSRLDCFVTVLGKIECLRRTVNHVSRGTTSVSSDDLLPVLVYLVIKAGLSNWTAQLAFMQQFRFSAKSVHETDEGSFLITSLEAAIEHVKSGTISRNIPCPESKKKECIDMLTARNETSEQPSSAVESLFVCIEKGELAEVERILTRNESPKQHRDVALCHPLCTCASCERNWAHQRDLKTYFKNDRGLTPLHMAVLCNQTAIVDYLLDHETDINVADVDGLTALHHACICGHQGILLHILHANADPTVTDSNGNTPLHCATERGHESCVKALLYLSEQMKVPVDVNAANDNGDTALHLAAKWGYVAIVRVLLECGANCKLTNRKGQTPLTVTYSTYISKLLEYYANIYTDSLHPRRAALSQSTQKQSQSGAPHAKHRAIDRLLAAIVEGDTCLACYYLGLEVYHERLPDVRCAVSGMCHPLCDCERCSAIGETLLERCKRRRALAINSCNSLGETALHVASATGRTDMVRLLLDAGANVNVTTASEGRTPLHLACLNGNIDLVKLLLNCATCYVDAQDYDGNTSLHLVSQAGNAKLVGLLLRHGANVDARNRHDMTPLRQLELEMSDVLTANYVDVLKMLKRNSPQPAQSSFDD